MASGEIRLRRRVVVPFGDLDVLGLAAGRRAAGPPRTATLVGVYAADEPQAIARLAADALALDWRVALWSLDRPAPGLEHVTVGTGRGLRCELVNRALDAVGWPAGPVVVTDDDVELARGGLDDLLAIGAAAGLQLYQPAHSWDSVNSWNLNYARPCHVARRVTYVEIGPVLVVEDGPARQAVLPLDESYGQGLGLDFAWTRLADMLAMGVVDAVAIRHLRPLGTSYERRREFDQIEAVLAELGVERPVDTMATTARWVAGRPPPGWR